MKLVRLAWILSSLLGGCADGPDRRPPVSALGHPRRSAEVIGVFDVHADSRGEALSALRDRAQARGADEVVETGVERDRDGAAAHGMAVRYQDPLAGRAYDLLGPVEVSAFEGREDEALDRLRAMALELHADLIIHVQLHYGEGGEGPTSLSGVALRFKR